MRLLLNMLIVLMFAALAAAAGWDYYHRASGESKVQETQHALAILHEKTRYHAAMARARYEEQAADAIAQDAPPPKPTPPPMILPQWFGPHTPVNALAPAGQPWIDLAPEGDLTNQPPDPILAQAHQAGFWFNPTLKLFRARVPEQDSTKATLDLYNQINGCALSSLDSSNDLARRPEPYAPPSAVAAASLPAADYASDVSATVTDVGPAPIGPAPEPAPVRKRSLLTHRPRD